MGDHLFAPQLSDLNNSLLNQCLHGLVDRLKRAKTRTINQEALRLGDARVGTVGYVIPCELCELFSDCFAPFVPRQEFQVCGSTEPTGNPLCVTSQGKRRR